MDKIFNRIKFKLNLLIVLFLIYLLFTVLGIL
jgi:hypothetical protein